MTPLGFLFRSRSGAAAPSSSYLPAGDTTKYPEVAIEVAFADAPTVLPTAWTDITPYVRHCSWDRGGRRHELQRTEAGSLTALLDNRDARFDPVNDAGAYWPNVKRMRWIRVRARWNSVEYARWQGLIESWDQEWPSGGRDATVTVRAIDAFKVLALYDLGGETYPAQPTGSRVDDVLDTVGVPHTADAGQSSVVATGTISVGTKALSHLEEVADTENGLLFANSAGQIVFQDRHYRLTETRSTTSAATVGDAGGSEIPYRQGRLDYGDAEVWPTVSVTPSGGTAETASDATSQADHFDRVLEKTILSDSQAEALACAQWLSGLYADPDPRIPTLELLPQKLTSSWPTVLNLENSDRLTWKRTAAAAIEMDVIVEQVSESVTPGRGWTVSLQVSPASSQQFWLLGEAGFSELDETTALAY